MSGTETTTSRAPAGWPDDGRLTDLVRRRSGELLRAAVLLTGSRADAEDVVQEAVIAVSRSWSTRLLGASEAAAFAYLRAAVVHKAIDALRRNRPDGDVPEEAVEDRNLLRYEDDRAFFTRLQGLPHQQRAVLVLRYYLDLDDRRIAALLQISRATVRSNAMRGLDKLRAQTTEDNR